MSKQVSNLIWNLMVACGLAVLMVYGANTMFGWSREKVNEEVVRRAAVYEHWGKEGDLVTIVGFPGTTGRVVRVSIDRERIEVLYQDKTGVFRQHSFYPKDLEVVRTNLLEK